jgi:hypothetical protein
VNRSTRQLLVDWSTSTAAGEQEYQAAAGGLEYWHKCW